MRTQTYFRLSLVSAKNNVCHPEPGNDLCDVMTFVFLWPIRFHDRMKLECSLQRIPRAVVLGLLELDCDRLKTPTSQKSFPGGDKGQPKIRLRLQANERALSRNFRSLHYVVEELQHVADVL